jgi:hypothetical protein
MQVESLPTSLVCTSCFRRDSRYRPHIKWHYFTPDISPSAKPGLTSGTVLSGSPRLVNAAHRENRHTQAHASLLRFVFRKDKSHQCLRGRSSPNPCLRQGVAPDHCKAPRPAEPADSDLRGLRPILCLRCPNCNVVGRTPQCPTGTNATDQQAAYCDCQQSEQTAVVVR